FQFAERSLVAYYSHVVVELQDRRRNLGSNRSGKGFRDDLRLVRTGGYKKNLLRLHDRSDSHCISLTGNVFLFFEEALVCLNSARRQIHAVCSLAEFVCRLVETDMSVMSDPQKLKVHSSYALNDLIVFSACFLTVRLKSVGNKSPALVDIYMIKEILVHKVTVALIIVSGKAFVLVQVHTCHLREIKISLFVPFHEILIC